MFELLGVCIVLAGLLTINSLLSVVAAAFWRGMERTTRGWAAARRACWLFALRVFPSALSVLAVTVLLVPAYVIHEPRHAAEAVSWKLALLAMLSAAGVALAAWRGFQTWRATRKLMMGWLRQAQSLELPGLRMPAFSIRHEFPLVAVVGSIRPRLFVAEQVFSVLTPNEIAAAIAHENGHLAARDNLKRVVMRICHDVLAILPCGRPMDHAWGIASETAADDYAAREGAPVALSLASALVKIARLVPAGVRPAIPAAALLVGTKPACELAPRIQHLTRVAACGPGKAPATRGFPLRSVWASCAAVLATGLLSICGPRAWLAVHTAMEHFVSALR